MSKNKNEKKGWWSRHAWIVAILLTLIVIITLVCLKCCNPVDNGGDGNPQMGDNNGNTDNGDDVPQPAPHTHTWGEYVETTPGDCYVDSIWTATCTCGATTTMTKPATHHQPTTWTREDETWHASYCQCGEYKFESPCEFVAAEVFLPDCEDEGYTIFCCTECENMYMGDIVPAKGHVWLEWVDYTDGQHKRNCENCSAIQIEDCFGGTADCENGARCAICDQEYTDPTGHDWSDWVDNGDGEHKRVCGNDADHVEYERHFDNGEKPGYCGTCDALLCGHNGKIHYDHDEDTHWEYCGVCSTPVTEKFAHQYEETSRVEYCTEEGTVTYACVCGDSYSETIQPVGHDWGPWVTQEDRTSVRTCKNDPTHTETMKVLAGNSVFVTTSTDMVLTVYRDVYEAYPGMYLEVSKPTYDKNGNEVSREVEIITEVYKMEDTKVRFLYRNVMAKEMSVGIDVKVFSGEGECLAEYQYSVRTYAENMLRKDQPMELKTLLVDMLNYGAAAQKYFNYLTDDLANKNLTEEELSWGTQEMPEMTDDEVLTKSEDENSIKLHGNAVSFENSVKLNIHFELGKHNLEDVNIVYTYLNEGGDERRIVVDATEATAIPEGYYRYTFDNAGYAGMRTMVKISFEDKETGEQIGDSVVCSVESYVAQKYAESTDETLQEVLVMILKYGDSANAYAKYIGA